MNLGLSEAQKAERKLRIALLALEQMALPSPGASNGESVEVMARRKAAQTALDRIGALR